MSLSDWGKQKGVPPGAPFLVLYNLKLFFMGWTTINGKKVRTIDATPTWPSLVPYLIQCIKEGGKAGSLAEQEFHHMANVAQAHVDHLKKTEKSKNNAKSS